MFSFPNIRAPHPKGAHLFTHLFWVNKPTYLHRRFSSASAASDLTSSPPPGTHIQKVLREVSFARPCLWPSICLLPAALCLETTLNSWQLHLLQHSPSCLIHTGQRLWQGGERHFSYKSHRPRCYLVWLCWLQCFQTLLYYQHHNDKFIQLTRMTLWTLTRMDMLYATRTAMNYVH